MSGSGICHCPGGQYYDRTKAFTSYATIEACLGAGGRHPKQGQGACLSRGAGAGTLAVPGRSSPARNAPRVTAYDRDAFGGWADDDRDCRNTRHELLAALSTGPVHYSADRCRVTHGRWLDPYTGRIFTEARDLDIDQLVPLAYAWARGANGWSPEQRRRFANDPVNLFAVEASANRRKGAAGPVEWLPPDTRFHCQYVTRFLRVAKTYRLVLPERERAGLGRLVGEKCG